MSDPKLAQVFKFDETDLQYNRQGVLSPRQQGNYAKTNRGCLMSSALITVMLIVFTVLMAAAFGKDALAGIIPLGIFSALGGLGTFALWSSRNDTFAIHQIEGQGHLQVNHTHSGVDYVINISGYEFSVSEDGYNILEDGANYRVFYTVMDEGDPNLKTTVKDLQTIERLA